jgi:hypothetical protein
MAGQPNHHNRQQYSLQVAAITPTKPTATARSVLLVTLPPQPVALTFLTQANSVSVELRAALQALDAVVEAREKNKEFFRTSNSNFRGEDLRQTVGTVTLAAFKQAWKALEPEERIRVRALFLVKRTMTPGVFEELLRIVS